MPVHGCQVPLEFAMPELVPGAYGPQQPHALSVVQETHEAEWCLFRCSQPDGGDDVYGPRLRVFSGEARGKQIG